MNILLRYSEQNRGCNVADEVREARLSIPWNSLNAMQQILLRLGCAPLRTTETELQAHQIDQELAPKVNHPAPGVFHVASSGLLENAFVNVVRDLVA